MISTSIMFTMIFVATFKVFFRLIRKGVWIISIIQLFTVGLLVGFVFSNHRAEFSSWNYQQLTYELFTRYNSIVAMVFSIFFCYFINFLL